MSLQLEVDGELKMAEKCIEHLSGQLNEQQGLYSSKQREAAANDNLQGAAQLAVQEVEHRIQVNWHFHTKEKSLRSFSGALDVLVVLLDF